MKDERKITYVQHWEGKYVMKGDAIVDTSTGKIINFKTTEHSHSNLEDCIDEYVLLENGIRDEVAEIGNELYVISLIPTKSGDKSSAYVETPKGLIHRRLLQSTKAILQLKYL